MKQKFIIYTYIYIHCGLLFAQNYSGLQVRYKICTGCTASESNDESTNSTAYTYGNTTSYSTADIESDYDMRRAGTGSRWHKGIDYSADGGNNLHKNLQETKQKSGITNM